MKHANFPAAFFPTKLQYSWNLKCWLWKFPMGQGYGFFMDMDEGSEETGALDGPDQESSKHMWWWQYANGDDISQIQI